VRFVLALTHQWRDKDSTSVGETRTDIFSIVRFLVPYFPSVYA
jgi:hypothetical protein